MVFTLRNFCLPYISDLCSSEELIPHTIQTSVKRGTTLQFNLVSSERSYNNLIQQSWDGNSTFSSWCECKENSKKEVCTHRHRDGYDTAQKVNVCFRLRRHFRFRNITTRNTTVMKRGVSYWIWGREVNHWRWDRGISEQIIETSTRSQKMNVMV